MSGDFTKILFTAHDPRGRDVWLVRFRDGRWGILLQGQCHCIGWPNGQLPPAARAYCDMIMTPRDAGAQAARN